MKKLSVFNKIFILCILLVMEMIFSIGLCIIPGQFRMIEKVIDDKLLLSTRIIAEYFDMGEERTGKKLSAEEIEQLDELTYRIYEIDFMLIVDKNDIVLYDTDHLHIGETFAAEEKQDALNGIYPYFITYKHKEKKLSQRCVFYTITGENEQVEGYIVTGVLDRTIYAEKKKIILQFLTVFMLALLTGIVFAYIISRLIKKSLSGYSPDIFVRMFAQREEILDSLNENLVVVNTAGKYLFCNRQAKELFHGDGLQKDFPLYKEFLKCLETQKEQKELSMVFCQKQLLTNFIPVFEAKELTWVIISSIDKSETVQFAERLTGANHLIEALRANTHEYMNKLHVISGLIQMGEIERLNSYISEISSDNKNNYQIVMRRIHNTTIAALIIGKNNHAKELCVTLGLRRDSVLEEESPFLTTYEIVAIVGNLIENGLEAAKYSRQQREVELLIRSGTEGITIVVDDTGCGLTELEINQIYSGQFTTKGEGHGVGLQLIQEIVRRHGGYFHIESEPGVGTSFIISITNQ